MFFYLQPGLEVDLLETITEQSLRAVRRGRCWGGGGGREDSAPAPGPRSPRRSPERPSGRGEPEGRLIANVRSSQAVTPRGRVGEIRTIAVRGAGMRPVGRAWGHTDILVTTSLQQAWPGVPLLSSQLTVRRALGKTPCRLVSRL